MRHRQLLLLALVLVVSSCRSSYYVEGMYSPATKAATATGKGSTSGSKTSSKNVSAQSPKVGSKTKSGSDVKLKEPALKEPKTTKRRSAIVSTAKKYLGCRYKAGATGPKTFDCSGFTYFVFKQFSVTLSRSSSSQYKQGTAVKDKRDLLPGDLVFFKGRNAKSSAVGHVGIVVEGDSKKGEFKFIHASSRGVVIDCITADYYKTRYIGARRVLD